MMKLDKNLFCKNKKK